MNEGVRLLWAFIQRLSFGFAEDWSPRSEWGLSGLSRWGNMRVAVLQHPPEAGLLAREEKVMAFKMY